MFAVKRTATALLQLDLNAMTASSALPPINVKEESAEAQEIHVQVRDPAERPAMKQRKGVTVYRASAAMMVGDVLLLTLAMEQEIALELVILVEETTRAECA